MTGVIMNTTKYLTISAYIIIAGFIIGILPQPAHAATIVSYTFGSGVGTLDADIGNARSDITWSTGTSVGYTSPFTSQGVALSVTSFTLGAYYQITLNATGYTDIAFNPFRTNGTAPAPNAWKLAYSLTGPSGTFTDVSTYSLVSGTSVADTSPPGFSFPSGANNNANVTLRMIATSSSRVDGGAGVASGSVRLDNLSFTGTAIPEPATYALWTGGLLLGVITLRKIKRPARARH